MIRQRFKKQASKQLRNLVSDWKRRMKKPTWMGGTLWKKFLQHWESEVHQVKSKRNSKARKSTKSVHNTGQKSFLRRRHEIRVETGEFPSHIELLEDTHKRKSDGVIVDPTTIEILDVVKKAAEERLSQKTVSEDGVELGQTQELTKAEMNDLFKSIVAPKKGRWYGLASISEYDPFSTSFTPSPMITSLQAQLQSTQEELNATKNIVTQQKADFEAQMAAMKTENEERFKAFEDRFFSPNHP
ncbi:unnamed protein product [Arabidopsis halleri]